MIKTLRNLRRQDKDKFRIPRSVCWADAMGACCF